MPSLHGRKHEEWFLAETEVEGQWAVNIGFIADKDCAVILNRKAIDATSHGFQRVEISCTSTFRDMRDALLQHARRFF